MMPWLEIAVIATPVAGGMIIYFVRLESKLAKIMNDICWIKKVMESRQTARTTEGK